MDTSQPELGLEKSATNSSNGSDLSRPAGATVGPKSTSAETDAERAISCMECRRRKLKCDRVRPCCVHCTRARQRCVWPERRKNTGVKRRSVKDLEARLADVEDQLMSANATGQTRRAVVAKRQNRQDSGLRNEDFGKAPPIDSSNGISPGNFFSQEVISLGLEEPLPPDDIVQELTETYFDLISPLLPMIHQYRFISALHRAPASRPPVCLRYAMWALAALRSDKYNAYNEVLYLRARRYAEVAEMKGIGEEFLSLYYAQAWVLICHYEACKLYFSRAWVNTGKCVRLCQALGLQVVDSGAGGKKMLPPTDDFIELEERRRTFWAAYYCDSYASAGTTWPMAINNDEIRTLLPYSDEAFQRGIMEKGMTMQEGQCAANTQRLDVFSGSLVSIILYGRIYHHYKHTDSADGRDDPNHGAYWVRHRELNDTLNTMLAKRSMQLRHPASISNADLNFSNMVLLSGVIHLQQAAVDTGKVHIIEGDHARRCTKSALVMANEMIVSIRQVRHVDPAKLNPWASFCLYKAAAVFLHDWNTDCQDPHNELKFRYLLDCITWMEKRHAVAGFFSNQLANCAQSGGIAAGHFASSCPSEARDPLVKLKPDDLAASPEVGEYTSSTPSSQQSQLNPQSSSQSDQSSPRPQYELPSRLKDDGWSDRANVAKAQGPVVPVSIFGTDLTLDDPLAVITWEQLGNTATVISGEQTASYLPDAAADQTGHNMLNAANPNNLSPMDFDQSKSMTTSSNDLSFMMDDGMLPLSDADLQALAMLPSDMELDLSQGMWASDASTTL